MIFPKKCIFCKRSLTFTPCNYIIHFDKGVCAGCSLDIKEGWAKWAEEMRGRQTAAAEMQADARRDI